MVRRYKQFIMSQKRILGKGSGEYQMVMIFYGDFLKKCLVIRIYQDELSLWICELNVNVIEFVWEDYLDLFFEEFGLFFQNCLFVFFLSIEYNLI